MNPLTARQIAAQARLRADAAARIAAWWRGLPAYDEANVAEFLRLAVPLSLGAQRSSALMTNAYLAAHLRRPALPLDVAAVIGAGARRGAPPDEVYRRPFVTTWTALKDGKPWADAVGAGLARAASTATMDVQLAMRATLGEQQDGYGITIYRRVADGNACIFCQTVDGARVGGDAMELHNGCGCSVEPETRGSASPSAVPDSVAVHDHGELGPVLTAPGDQFTQL